MENSCGALLYRAIPIQPSGGASALLDTPDLRDDNGNNTVFGFRLSVFGLKDQDYQQDET